MPAGIARSPAGYRALGLGRTAVSSGQGHGNAGGIEISTVGPNFKIALGFGQNPGIGIGGQGIGMRVSAAVARVAGAVRNVDAGIGVLVGVQ